MTRGVLEIIAGPMFAGKTSALLAKARSSNGETVLIKPSFDTRYGICEIKTHDGISAEAFNLSNVSEILNDDIVSKAEIILFDEIQFFTEPFFGGDIIACIDTLLNRGINVTCCGLDMNWKGEPFEIVSKLRKIADKYISLTARCAVCNEPAIYTHKRSGTGESVELGAEELYEPRCAKHFPFSPAFENPENEPHDDHLQGDLFVNIA